jgi:hypothetical protein
MQSADGSSMSIRNVAIYLQVCTACINALMIEAVWTSQTSVCFNETTTALYPRRLSSLRWWIFWFRKMNGISWPLARRKCVVVIGQEASWGCVTVNMLLSLSYHVSALCRAALTERTAEGEHWTARICGGVCWRRSLCSSVRSTCLLITAVRPLLHRALN